MAKDKHKKKKYYTVSVTSNLSVEKTKYYRSRLNIFSFSITVMLCVVALGAALTWFMYTELTEVEKRIQTFDSVIAEKDNTITELENENSSILTENKVLNTTLAKMIEEDERQAEEYALKHIPSAFPLTGAASLVDPSTIELPKEEEEPQPTLHDLDIKVEEKDEDEAEKEPVLNDPIVVFSMSTVSDVLSTADGIVSEIDTDEVFGNYVKVDHGNGYISIYRNSAEPKVSVGDEIVRGFIIYVGGADDNLLGYQITKDGEFIDPMELMEVDG